LKARLIENKLMKKLIVIADLGRLRVLRVREDDLAGGPTHLEELTDEVTKGSPERISDVVTDQQGRFASGGPAGQGAGGGAGDRHGLEAEMARQSLVGLAAQIDETVAAAADGGNWLLAAPQAILKQLEEKLSPASREHLHWRVPGDLTKLTLKALEKRFI
jgi:hypothetical protein